MLERYTLLSSGTNEVLSSLAASIVLKHAQYSRHAMEVQGAGDRVYICGGRRSAEDYQDMDGAASGGEQLGQTRREQRVRV